MDKVEEKKIELIETLIEEKDFTELSKTEKDLVLEILESESEYNLMKEANAYLVSYKRPEGSLPLPRPGIIKNLKIKGIKKTQSRERISPHKNIFKRNWNISVYQTAVAIVLIFIFFIMWDKIFPDPSPQVLVEQVVIHDTIQVIQPKDTVFIEKYVYRNPKPATRSVVGLNEELKMEDIQAIIKAKDYLEQVNNHKGYSLEEKDYLLTLNIEDE